MKIILIYTSALLLVFAGCKKEDPPPVPPEEPSNAEQIVGFKWQLTDHIQLIGSGSSIYDIQYPSCEKDDIFTFGANNYYIRDEGLTKCFVNNPQIDTAYYSMPSDNSIITIIDSDSMTYTITSVSSSSLRLRFLENNINNELVFTRR